MTSTPASRASRTAKPSRRRTEQILADRARALAEPARDAGLRGAGLSGAALRLVGFTLDGERFALEARYVRAAGRAPDITPIPGSADFVHGVTSFRGQIVAVFDLRIVFARSPQRPAAHAHLLFLGREEIEFAVVADTLDGILLAPADSVTRRPWRSDAASSGAPSGLTPDALDVLDGAALLDSGLFHIDQA